MALGWKSRADRWVVSGLKAAGRRFGRVFAFEAADLMAARVPQLRRLSRLPRAFRVRPALPADEPGLRSLVGHPGKAKRLSSSGDVGLLATADGVIHAMEWVRLGPAEYDWDARRLGVAFKVPPRCCWLHNGRNSRDGGVGPWAMVLGRLPDFLDERGIETAFLSVDSDNRYSGRCHESLGFRRVGRIAALRFGRRLVVGLRGEGGPWVRLRGGLLDLGRLPI